MKVTSIQSFYGVILSTIKSTKPKFSKKGGDKATLRAQKLYGEMELHVSGTTLLLRWGSSLAAVALHCCCDGKDLLLR